MCVTITMNRITSDEEFGHYKWYQSLIFSQTLGLKGVDCGVLHRLERLWSIYVRTLTQHYRNFFQGEKQNQGGLIGSHVCATITVNRT